MEKKLENIFVPYEIAKLAYEKGFNELCVCMASPKSGYFPNFGNNGNKEIIFFYDAQKFEFDYYFCPTHFQLIAWLQSNHNVHLRLLIKVVNFLFLFQKNHLLDLLQKMENQNLK